MAVIRDNDRRDCGARIQGEAVTFRIHFTAQDLARTRVSDAPEPLAELQSAARALQDRSQPVRLDAWRRRAWAQFPDQARMALSLIPPVGWAYSGPGSAHVGKFEEQLEEMRAIPRKDLKAEMSYAAELGYLPSWVYGMTDDAALFGQFVDSLASLYSVLLSPYEAQLGDLFVADRTVRLRQFLDGGVERLLVQANPRWMRWNQPVLEIRMANGIDYDLRLEGRGVLLMPSMFGTRSFVLSDAESQPIVTYPAGQDQPLRRLTTFMPEHATSGSSSAVSALLGRTRAAVLNTIAEHPGCSTKELATLVGIAPASASEHATVLRQAGLITTTRHRNTALHSPTDLGIALLNRP